MRHRLEYALAWLIVMFLGALPRPLVRAAGISLGWIIYLLHHRLRSVGIRNPYLDHLSRQHLTMHGNTMIDKDEPVRALRSAMKAGETVGILMDTNMTPQQGVFVNFFGIPACTPSGLARIALRTDAAVAPGFTIWDPKLQKYRLRFDPVVELIRTGNDEADIIANTQRFTEIIEDFVRRYP